MECFANNRFAIAEKCSIIDFLQGSEYAPWTVIGESQFLARNSIIPMRHYSRHGHYIKINANRISKIVKPGLNERSK